MGLLSERLRLSASWEPLGGSPEPPQVRTRDMGVRGEATEWLPPDTSVARRWLHGKKKLWKLTMIPSLQKNFYVVSGLHYKPRDDTMNYSFKT